MRGMRSSEGGGVGCEAGRVLKWEDGVLENGSGFHAIVRYCGREIQLVKEVKGELEGSSEVQDRKI